MTNKRDSSAKPQNDNLFSCHPEQSEGSNNETNENNEKNEMNEINEANEMNQTNEMNESIWILTFKFRIVDFFLT